MTAATAPAALGALTAVARVTTVDRTALLLILLAAAVSVLPQRPCAPRARRAERRPRPGARRMAVAALGVGAAGVLLGVTPWLVVAGAVAAAVAARLSAARRRGPSAAEMRDLAGTFDLLATSVSAGLPVGRAIAGVLAALDVAAGQQGGGPVQRRAPPVGAAATRTALTQVAALLALGADPASAWRPAARRPELASLAAAAQRSAVAGVTLADAIREAAADVRDRCRNAAGRTAARAGVAMTAPLALCFLPAFVCLGLAPVVIGLVSTLHIW